MDKKGVPTVSVIIPVYRTGDYLEECIESVLIQDYENLEILLVDDGSPDKCPALCNWYAEGHSQIRVFHQENHGPGAARNTGLKEARGDFILFLDSDDLLNGPNTIQKLVDAACRRQADIVTGNYRCFQGNKYGSVNRHHLKDGDYTKTVDFRLKGFLTEGHLIMDWGKLYRKGFLVQNHLWSKQLICMEDKLRNMMCCTCRPVYAFVDDCIYLHRIAKDSITQQYQERAVELERTWIYVAEYFDRFLKGHPNPEEYIDLLAFHVLCGVFTIGRQPLRVKGNGISESIKLLRDYGKNRLVHHTLLALARGKYLKGIRTITWRILLQGTSILFCMGAYRLVAWGIFFLQGIGTQRKESRLKDGEKKTAVG